MSDIDKELGRSELRKLLKTDGKVLAFKAQDWSELMTGLKSGFLQKFTSTASDVKILSELDIWITDALEFLQYISAHMQELSLQSKCIILDSMLSVVNAFISFYKTSSLQSELANSLKDTLLLHKLALTAIDETLCNLHEIQSFEPSGLTEIIDLLCAIGEQSVTVDIKILVETLKCITKLMFYCSKCNDTEEASSAPAEKWLKRPFRFLLQEISKNLTLIYDEQALEKPIEEVEKCLKVNNFYVKLLHRITTEFKQRSLEVGKEFFETLCTANRMPKYIENTKIAELAQRYVLTYLQKDILALVYTQADFQQALQGYLREELSTAACFGLLRDYLKAVVLSQNVDFIEVNANEFIAIFERLVKDVDLFLDATHFNDIITFFAALTQLCPSAKLKKYFMHNALTANFSIAHASTELLIVMAGCTLEPTELLHDFRFWRKCNETFALFSSSMHHLHAQRLLRYYFKLCKAAPTVKSVELWDRYMATQITRHNYAFFLAVGLTNTVTNAGDLQRVCVRLTDELFDMLKGCDKGCSKDAYYKMITYMELIAGTEMPPKKELLNNMFKLLLRICTNAMSNLQSFMLYFNACFKLAANALNIDPLLLEILLCINKHLQQHTTSIPPSVVFVNFLERCVNDKSDQKLKATASAILTAMQTSSQPPLLEILNMKSNLHGVALCNEVSAKLYKINEVARHKCAEPDAPYFQSNKRLRLDNGEKQTLKDLLKDMTSKSKEILQTTAALDSDDCCTLKSIISNLKMVLE